MDELDRFGHGAPPPVAEHAPAAAERASRDCHDCHDCHDRHGADGARGGGSGERGFTLIETLVALTLLFVLLIGLSTGLLVARRSSEALKARRQVDRLLEASLETLRAGELPVRSGPLPIDPGAGVDFPVALQLEVSPQGLGGLDLVVVRAIYLRQGDPVEQRLASQIWSPR